MLNQAQRETLEAIKRAVARLSPVRLVERARVVLHAADGLEDKQIAGLTGMTRQKAEQHSAKRYAAMGLAGDRARPLPRLAQPAQEGRIDDQQRARLCGEKDAAV